ncbi:MAG: hypothetical protein AB7G75_11940 [Candidatus Binatia bacterium]
MKDQRVADGGASVFQPDFLLPLQFFTGIRGKACAEGERRLMLAILVDAVECFQKYLIAKDNRGRQLWTDAEAWFLSDERDWIFSFVNVSEALGLDPEFLRQGLLNWKTQQLERIEQGFQPDFGPESAPARGANRKRNAMVAV